MSRKIDRALRTLAGELRAAEDRLADDEHELDKWGFAKTPSERRRLSERIEQDRRDVAVCERAAAILDPPDRTAGIGPVD